MMPISRSILLRKLRSFKTLFAAVLMAVTLEAVGQTDALVSNYFEVPSYYNPAAVGTTDLLRIRAGARLQWVGIDNAPTTFMATGDMPFMLFNKRFGTGLMFQQESMGLYSNLTIGAQLGYKIQFKKGFMKGSTLTIGIQPGFISESFKGSKVFIPDNDDYHDANDEAIPTNDVAGNAFDLGIGAFWANNRFWAGVSCTHALSPTIRFSSDSGSGTGTSGGSTTGEGVKNFEFSVPRTLYFMAGGNIPVKNTLFEVMPSVIVRSDFTFTNWEVTGRVRYRKFLTAGVGYRYNDAVTLLLGAEFKGITFCYSYDYATSAIAKASSGSHELFVGYSLKLDFSEKNRHRHKSIRII
ncbi:MAG: PorP/SprF family type IX secretion system membrane protein [Paramuribaculum sp.]|nr:PorP/SprF family type IX secretion system membrane protein [Paramuribaculum sp.]